MPKDTLSPIISVAIASPLRRCFDYLAHDEGQAQVLSPGQRVKVPFGRQKNLVGIVISTRTNDGTHPHKLRPIDEVLEDSPSIDQAVLELCQWCANYYHYPLGEVCHLALPALLRKPIEVPKLPSIDQWQLSDKGRAFKEEKFGRASKQREAWQLMQNQTLDKAGLKEHQISRATMNSLIDKGLVEKLALDSPSTNKVASSLIKSPPHALNSEQAQALASIVFNQFNAYLLDGVTGSGKTEVYLQAITPVIEAGQQVLILVPEIGLTPQTVGRFQARFNTTIATLHSGMSDKQRLIAWQQAKSGETRIIIGTRSAIFTPMPELGLIIVDEEHDLSYKQQEGVRYSARDLGIIRAQKKQIPIVLGSATPSLETLHNAISQRFTHLVLRERATSVALPKIRCVEARDDELSPDMIHEINQCLQQGQQALVFINRRGYAPTLMCKDCGWMSQCDNCDSRMTLHRPNRGQQHQSFLHCHHCDTKAHLPKQCPQCHSHRLEPLGQGTQRSEEALRHAFPNTPVLRIDRDSISKKGELEKTLEIIHSQEACILVGTQMLAKGHHFPNVSLAIILGLDSSFFSSDFRGCERMGQLITQVAGRAGREKHQGQVLLQTQFSEHPLLKQLIEEGYDSLARQLLAERKLSAMPPFEHLAFIRCHASQPSSAQAFLAQAREYATQIQAPSPQLQYVGPFPATMEKRNNRFHYYLQIKSSERRLLHHLIGQLAIHLEQQTPPKGLHWLIDIDPQEV